MGRALSQRFDRLGKAEENNVSRSASVTGVKSAHSSFFFSLSPPRPHLQHYRIQNPLFHATTTMLMRRYFRDLSRFGAIKETAAPTTPSC